jgi:hypothetical protein
MMKVLRISGLLGGVLLSSCAVDTGDESLGSVESEISGGRWYASWGTTNGPTLDITTGSQGVVTSDWTCFLSGVAGNLNAGWGWDHPGRWSEASVDLVGGHWILTGEGGADYGNVPMNNPVNARAVCVHNVTNRFWTSMGGAGGSVNQKITLGTATANRVCMLNDVTGYSGSWISGSARAKVFKENGNWVFETANIGTSAGIPFFSAVCFDLPAGTWVGTGTWFAGTNMPILTEGGPGECGLSGIAGSFSVNSWTNGDWIDWPDTYPGVWTIDVGSGKTGFVTCF